MSGFSNGISNDLRTAFVSNACDYATTMNQHLALPVPLGSQLNLLSVQNQGNPYLQYDRIADKPLGSLQNILTGYGSLYYSNPNTTASAANTNTNTCQGSYATFAAAYGK